MAENETGGVATEEQEFNYPITVEDAGPATKKVSVTIPQSRIEDELNKQYKDVRSAAAIPGFRPGRAPERLVRKRFGADIKEQVRNNLVRESYQQAVEKNNLEVLGEPEFEEADKLDLPETGDLKYTFSVEVQPQINLPDLKGLKVKKPKIEVNEEHVNQAMQNLREQQGTLVPVEDRGVETKDFVTADVHVKQDGNEVGHQHDAQIVARPGRIAGLQIDDLDAQLAGAKPGDTRTISTKIPDNFPREELRGKDVQIEVKVKDIKRLEPATIDQDFLDSLGFANEQELREALREQLVERINYDVAQAMREQVNKYLLENTNVELPTKLSDRQEHRVVNRRAVDLMMRGVPREQIEANVEALRGGAKDEAIRELKLFFILQKIANDQNVDVDESELNGRIAMIAAQEGRRPEKLKQEMAKDGRLQNLYIQAREQKAVDKILETAEVEEVEVPQGQQTAGEQQAAEKKD